MKLFKLSMVLCRVVLSLTLPRFFRDTKSGELPPRSTPPVWVALNVAVTLVDAKSGVEVDDIILVS